MMQPLFLGIEIGGTKLQLGLGFGDGRLLALERMTIIPAQGAAGILHQIKQSLQSLRTRPNLEGLGSIVGAGVGYGGPVDTELGRVIRSYQIEGWDDFPLGQWIENELSIPSVQIQNDADTAGLAEARFGAGQGLSPIMYVTVGSGIGGALIIDGKIYRGADRGAAEIGHLLVPCLGDEGQTMRELELIASGWGIAERGKKEARRLNNLGSADWSVLREANGDPNQITTMMIANAATQGDSAAIRILEVAHHAIAFALQQAIALVSPRRIILGGGVSLIGERLWYEPIRKLVHEGVFLPFQSSYDIVPPVLGEEVVVHGAIALAFDAFRGSR